MTHRSRILPLIVLSGSWLWGASVHGAEQKPAPDPNDPTAVLGTLICSLTGEGDGASSGVGRDMLCRFQPGRQGPQETYSGSVQGVGKADLLFGKGAVLLSVKGPSSTKVTAGLLTQTYAVDAGASGSAFAPLVGEKNKQMMLQPLAEQEGRVAEGKTQPDAVIIRVELTLQSTSA